MIEIVPVPYKGLEEIIKNIEIYKKKFIDESIIVFRDANMSLLEQENFNKSVGKELGWNPYQLPNSHYQENHSHNKRVNTAGPDDIMLTWHIEHPYYSNPIVVGLWNMFKLTAPVGAGKTYFMNTSTVYDRFTIDDKNFLKSCILNGPPQSKQLYIFYKNVEYPAISENFITKLPIITILLNPGEKNHLSSFNHRAPTKKEQEKFNDILYKIIDMIECDESIRMVHTWKQGDLVLMDGSLAHAVTGGFTPESREFYGMWGHKNFIDTSETPPANILEL